MTDPAAPPLTPADPAAADHPSSRRALVVMAWIVVLVLAGVAAYLAVSFRSAQVSRADGAAQMSRSADLATVRSAPHLIFRSTAPGPQYGHVAAVALDDPDGPRAFTPAVCDRVDATIRTASCLRTVRGIVTTFEADILDGAWEVVDSNPLAGIPSRTRLSDDGALVASTAFVTGHSYAATGFSTQTEIAKVGGGGWGNIESFTLLVDGAAVTAADRNIWGVTFAGSDRFYATAASASLGAAWLVEGDLAARTLTAVRAGVECPSLSPDGTRIAYKKARDDGTWGVAVLELATMEETVLAESRNVDDQVEWLDEDTVLYGLPRADEPGTTDVWSLPATEAAVPALFVPYAWSPSVVLP